MRSRLVAAFVLVVTLAGFVVAVCAAAHNAERSSARATARDATVATASIDHVALVAPAKGTSVARDAWVLGTSVALVALLVVLRFACRDAVFVRPDARALGTRRRRAPPAVLV